jgi:lysyl-tRNA synthetase class 1
MPAQTLIGKGTWLDKVAKHVVDREQRLGRSLSIIRVESGLGASGIPHIGNLSDTIRAYGIQMALENLGYRSEHIAFVDDMDGLRKVPKDVPTSFDLTRYLAHPVSRIPDPFVCHSSFGEHMGSLLREAMDRVGIKYRYETASSNYRSGRFLPQIRKILSKSGEVGRAIRELSGQEKFERALPYFPVCPNCGRIYTTNAKSYDPSTDKVQFSCVGVELKGRFEKGCGYEGEMLLASGEGKLSWKVEFATRWAALDIRYEAHGKELTTSVKVNDWVSDNILGFPHPYHVRWELILDKSGKKISKSEGSVITPQTWFRYGTSQSLVLLMFKRIVGTRTISIEDIPKYMDELDRLEDIYHGKVRVEKPEKLAKLKGLYEYVTFMQPDGLHPHVPYRLLAELCRVAPAENYLEWVQKKLVSYRLVSEPSSYLEERISLARNWAADTFAEPQPVILDALQRKAIADLVERLGSSSSPEQVQNLIFEVAKSNGIPAPDFFKILYTILLGTDRGPRLGPYICDLGLERASILLKRSLGSA